MHTMVRVATPEIFMSLIKAIKKLTREGFPGGCLNACAGSECSQNSSSQSIGRSRSMLYTNDIVSVTKTEYIVECPLFVLDDTEAAQMSALLTVYDHQGPARPMSEAPTLTHVCIRTRKPSSRARLRPWAFSHKLSSGEHQRPSRGG